jgi:hypothetical protein
MINSVLILLGVGLFTGFSNYFIFRLFLPPQDILKKALKSILGICLSVIVGLEMFASRSFCVTYNIFLDNDFRISTGILWLLALCLPLLILKTKYPERFNQAHKKQPRQS